MQDQIPPPFPDQPNTTPITPPESPIASLHQPIVRRFRFHGDAMEYFGI